MLQSKSITMLLLAGVLGLQGCLGNIPGLTKGDAAPDSEDATRTKTEGTVAGAALGGLLGALFAGDDNRAQGAAIGALLGGGAGYLAGSEVAKRKQAYANQEDLIAGEIQRTEESIRQLKSVNAELQKDIIGYRKQIARLKLDIRTGKDKQAELKTQKTKVEARHKQAREALAGLEKEIETSESLYQDARKSATPQQSADLKQWEKRIGELKAQKVQLEQHSGQLQAVSSGIAL
jgi:uncharacterized protein YcfJ